MSEAAQRTWRRWGVALAAMALAGAGAAFPQHQHHQPPAEPQAESSPEAEPAPSPTPSAHEQHQHHQPAAEPQAAAEPAPTPEPAPSASQPAPAPSGHEHHAPAAPQQEPASPPPAPAGHDHHGAAAAEGAPAAAPEQGHAGHAAGGHVMRGLLGNYPISREASGTAWQPEAAPHGGFHLTRGPWELMAHGVAFAVYSDQGGRRGDDDLFGLNMAMGIAQRPWGAGTLGLKSMLSLEPATAGRAGYPLLLQTGETADGHTPLVDRQHPHDLLMELAATYSVAVTATDAVFVYVAWPGEPALGPANFMHRFSAMENPEAPLAHHWLDSTHIAWGVLTAGWHSETVMVEGSLFTGRESDEHRWDVEEPRLDSQSARLTWNPTASWSMQASFGRLQSPEQLEPDVDVDRSSLSASYVRPLVGDGRWGATFAWGRNDRGSGASSDALLLEGTLQWAGANTLYARAERVENDELVAAVEGEAPDPPHEHGGHGEIAVVGELSAGYLRDFLRRDGWALGAGGFGRVSLVPRSLEASYGSRRPLSWGAMLRLVAR